MSRGRLAVALLLASASLAACSDDASSDGQCPIAVNFDNQSCGDRINFTGEYVDWDKDTVFCGINEALLEVQGGGAMDVTSPNGRFESICVPDQPVTVLDVTPPAAASSCTVPSSTYSMAGIAVAHRDVIRAGAFFSARNFTAARRDPFFQQAGFSFAPALAQVLVHVHGTPRAVSIAATHAPAQAIVDKTWAPGDTGHDVFFPNVDPGASSTTLSVAGGATGTGTIPLVAGKFTYVTVCAQ